jgi:hypothetical protein
MPLFDEKDKLKRMKFQGKTFECVLAYLYLENVVRSQYGTLFTGLNVQQSLGHKQYPKTVTEANNVLSNDVDELN